MTKKTMLDYINESGIVCKENVLRSQELTRSLVEEFMKNEFETIWIVASGSSYNGALAARSFIRNILDIEVKLISPANFVAYENNISNKDFVFVISQTGYSTNSLSALRKIRDMGYVAIGVTGDPESDFREASDIVIDYGVGIETVHYVTKGVTTLVVFLALFAVEVANRKGLISDDEKKEYKNEIIEIMDAHPKIIKDSNAWIENNIKSLSSMENVYMCAFGANIGTIYEGTLKVGETVHIPCLPYELEEFIHGPNLQLSPKYNLFIFDNGDHTHGRSIEIFEASKMISDRSYLITNTVDSDDPRVIKVYNNKTESLNPLSFLPVVQMLASYISTYLSCQQHPLLQKFKDTARAKSSNYKED